MPRPSERTGSSAASSGTTRRQPAVSTACDFCRRRKIRCNGEQPCDKCQQHSRANSCHFQDAPARPGRRPKNTASPALDQAQSRIRHLEEQLASARQHSSPIGPRNVRYSSTESSFDSSRAAARLANGVSATHTVANSHTLSDDSEDEEASYDHGTSTVAQPSRPSSSTLHAASVGPRNSSPLPTSPTSSAVANIIADLGNPRHSIARSDRAASSASPSQHGTRGVMSNLRVNNRGESRYHGPTSASFSAPEPLIVDAQADAAQGHVHVDGAADGNARDDSQNHRLSLDPAELTDRLTSLAAREKQQELMNSVAGRLDFDGVEPELAIHLLNLHWNRQHHAYLVTYRPLFMRDMAAPPGKAKYFSKLLFHAILFGAAKFSDRTHQVRSDVNDPSTAGQQFLERVQQLLPEALIKSRITTVQALLLLACTHYARGSESAAWLHSGLAFRMAIDLGMNEDSIELVASGNMALEELELRRRVVWAAFVIDKIHSLYQGRQASIERRNLYVPIEFHDHFEETEFWTPVAFHRPLREAAGGQGSSARGNNGVAPTGYTGPIYSVSTFAELCRLTVIMEKIIQIFYSIDSGARSERAQTEHLIGMRSELASWRTSLPAHLRIDSNSPASRNGGGGQRSRTCPPNLISLHALYHALTILLNRPFLPHGHLRSDDAASGRSAWKACVDAASSISSLMNLYRQTVSMKGAPQLISYINFCAAGIHVRVAAQLQQSNNTSGEAAANTAAASSRRYELKALRQCLQDFEENQDPNPGVVKAKSVIRNMAERAGILELIQDDGEEGGLSPMNQDESPTTSGSGGQGNGQGVGISSSGITSGNEAVGRHGNALSMATLSSSASMTAPSATGGGATATALNRLGGGGGGPADNSALGMTPPYEIDFESILASFDQFESAAGPGRDGFPAGAADPNTNSDILFGFLRDYDAPSALSL
ncbi:predicted transcription factor [Pseudozyma hubeiensis SY62]|uniref:Predicted transcription factor n=1 Tax=Pseudozyma hubeiensis (strain SY62) TaxID=1305764 RepID=R9NXR1_PSEHS|nr:predicted transcription factor [Pseudozyma hubeiensis SY62]GAC93381.1 predicted transcription factor [Pseudozyma hubeiensis SY62]